MTKRQRTILYAILLGVIAVSQSARAGPNDFGDLMRGGGMVVDQQPLNSGGPGADTDFFNDSGFQSWQQVADDILLTESATVRRIVWWGFYGGNFTGSTEPPTGSETMRVRFYDARPDGLPGATLYEQSLLNPSRTATGRINFSNSGLEYIFQVDLATPFDLDAGAVYWLEIVQLGDLESTYRWEYSSGTGDPYALKNTFFPDWQRTSLTANVAFHLWTIPEPTMLTLVLFGLVLAARRKKR